MFLFNDSRIRQYLQIFFSILSVTCYLWVSSSSRIVGEVERACCEPPWQSSSNWNWLRNLWKFTAVKRRRFSIFMPLWASSKWWQFCYFKVMNEKNPIWHTFFSISLVLIKNLTLPGSSKFFLKWALKFEFRKSEKILPRDLSNDDIL